MGASLVIAAPPLIVLLLVLWWLDRAGGRSGWLVLLSVAWGGLGATGLVMLTAAIWLEQPSWYPVLVSPVAEELSKALIFVALVWFGLVPSVPAGLACGLACGLGFALWENAAYFDRLGSMPPAWLYMTRTTGTALLHAMTTGLVGAAAGAWGSGRTVRGRVIGVVVALGSACLVHGSWNYVCLVLSDTSAVRRALPAGGVALLLVLVVWSVVKERAHLKHEVLALWRDGVIPEDVARALVRRWPVRGLRRAGVHDPAAVSRSVWRLATARRQLAGLSDRSHRVRALLARAVDRWQRSVHALLDGAPAPAGRRIAATHVALASGLALVVGGLHVLGSASPVPAALARRTVVVVDGAVVRPEPLLSVVNEDDAYLLWQRGPSIERREQLLTWIGPGQEQRALALGPIPPGSDDWFDMTTLGRGVLVATRHGARMQVRSFARDEQIDELSFDAPERDAEPCWPWLASDRGRTLAGWDRLRRVAWLTSEPLALGARLDLPDPFRGVDETPDQACVRGFLFTDHTVYQVARPLRASRLAAIDLETLNERAIDLCPGEPDLRVHSLDKDRDEVLVLLGGRSDAGYRLFLARLDRSGNLREPCRPIRDMPAGEPSVVALAGAGETAFLAWATGSHIFLARIPLGPAGGRSRRWVLDRAPPDGTGVVRVGVTEGRLYVAWEGFSPPSAWSLKLLRTEIDDLP